MSKRRLKLLTVVTVFSILLTAFGCQKKDEAEDTPVMAPPPVEGKGPDLTASNWIDSRFLDPLGKEQTFKVDVLLAGGPADPLSLTHAQANAPVARFLAGGSGEGDVVSPVPFLAFAAAELAKVTIRHIKSVNGQNVGSQVLVPVGCSEPFLGANPPPAGMRVYCLPLINAVVPGFLVPTDNSGAYLHEFIISVKRGGLDASVLTTKIGSRIIIPGQTLSVAPSADLRALSLSDRLTIATNDLVGSPRRDFRAFEINGDIAPGVQTEWVLTFKNLKIMFEEEIFFELPVVAGDNPARPLVNRGSSFFKRKVAIDSADFFRLRVANGNGENEFYNVATSSGAAQIFIPIMDGTQSLRLFVTTDFGSDLATRSYTEYVRPFAPTFCPRELAAFKPEEWRQARVNPFYVACEALSRSRIVDAAEAAKKGVSSPIETFFGAFSYMPRLGGTVLGGTNGVLSLRAYLTGRLTAAVRNPHDLSTTTEVGSLDLSYTFLFPTAIQEMDAALKAGRATPGLDTILSSLQRKGVTELARRDSGRLPSFPFQGVERDDVLH